jgi:hypothetical protein
MSDRPLVRVFCHPVDVVDDLAGTLDDIATVVPDGCQGPAGLALAAAYHSSRDYLPRNRRRVHHSPAGTAFLTSTADYPPDLPPLPAMPVCSGEDLLASAVAAGTERGIDVDAWVVYLHHDEAIPTGTKGRVVNAFGDSYPLALCPASPITIAYAVALTRDVASRRPRSIIAEALHPQAFVHDFHHERMFGSSGGLRRFLMGLCFCGPCIEAGLNGGTDVAALREWVCTAVDGDEGSGPLSSLSDLDRRACAHGAGLVDYLRIRAAHTTDIVSRCAREARTMGVGFTWLDASHALAETDAGHDATHDPGWQLGVDLAAIAGVCDVVTASYADSEPTAARDADRVTRAMGRRPDGGIVRLLGDSDHEHRAAAERIAGLVAREVGWIGLYHYGLAPVHLAEVLRRGTREPFEEKGDS